MCKSQFLAAALAFTASTGIAFAGEKATAWTLDPALSTVAFGSIKNDYIGESHAFSDVSGSVSADGAVSIEVGLGSVATAIDIRNERMIEHVFQTAPKATISAEIEMADLADLPVGAATTVETWGALTLLGTETELDAKFFVMRLTDDKVLVTSDGMMMLSTEDAGINAGIDVLQELAGLDSITRVSPVTLRLVFNAGDAPDT